MTRESRSRKRKDLQVKHAPHLSPSAKLIKLADKISNVREIGVDPPTEWDLARRQNYFAWARDVVSAIGQINPALEEQFAATVEKSVALLAAENAG